MNLIFLQVIQEPIHGILDGRKSIMCSMNVVGVILLTVAIFTIQAGNNNSDYTIRYSLSLMFCKICQALQISFYFSEDTYFLGTKGFKACTNGSAITNKTECVVACNYLKLPLKSMTDGKNCFRAGNGDCKQSASHGATAKLVCKKQGNK